MNKILSFIINTILLISILNLIPLAKANSSGSFKITCGKIVVLPISGTIENSLQKGIVKVVGKTCYSNQRYHTVEVGDIVLHHAQAGINVTINEQKIIIMHESDVIAILPEQNNINE